MHDESDSFDFKKDPSLPTSFAADYLRQYYLPERPVTDDEKAVYRFLRKATSKLSPHIDCLEIGCGPTVHHAIMLSPFVGSITLADYLEENLHHVDLWRRSAPGCWDWSAYVRFCLREDGEYSTNGSAAKREELTRSKISQLRTIDVLSDTPLGSTKEQFGLVATFYCTEEVALTTSKWKKVLQRVTTLVKPGGHLLISCLEETDFYHICGPDGVSRKLPCARISKTDLKETLSELGYLVHDDSIECIRTPNQIEEGVSGVLLAFVEKPK